MRGPNWRGLGRAKVPVISAVREATAEDIGELRNMPKAAPKGRVGKIRDHHHRLAVLFAAGYTNVEIREITGRSLQSISNFRNDPACQELTEFYRPQIMHEAIDRERYRYALKDRRSMLAEEMLTERFQDAAEGGEPIPTRDLQAAIVDHDRKFGPIELKASVNVDGTFASRMAAITERSMKAKLVNPSASLGRVADGSGTGLEAPDSGPVLTIEHDHVHVPTPGPLLGAAFRRRF